MNSRKAIRQAQRFKAYIQMLKVLYLLAFVKYIRNTVTTSEPDTGLTASATGTIGGGESAFVQLTLEKTRGQTFKV